MTWSEPNPQAGDRPTSRTKVVMLGTGTPRPDPERSGPATVIVVDNTPYLIDFGPGVVRRAVAAFNNGIEAIGPAAKALTTVFLTHLHADHTAGYPDLILTPWILGRSQPLNVYGPNGLKDMTENVLRAWHIDIESRLRGTDRLPAQGCAVNVYEVKPGLIYEDRNIRASAFPAKHAGLKDAFGLRIETPDRTIVISGDTAPTPSMAENYAGCDILIHEAYSRATYNLVAPKWQTYRRESHTCSSELAELAKRVRPGLLVLYHRVNIGAPMGTPDPEDVLLQEIREIYDGRVVTGHDLDVF